MKLSGNAGGMRGLLAGLAAISLPIAVYAQGTTTNPSNPEKVEEVAPLLPTQSTEDVPGELETSKPQHGAIFDVGIEDAFPRGWRDGRAELRDKGFDFGFAYTALWQQASGGPGERNGAGGDVDIFGTWRLIGTPKQNAGSLVWAADNRHALFTDLTPGELGPALGTLSNTTDGFNERAFAVRQLFWQQNLYDNKVVVSAGKIDPGVFYNGNRASNDNMLALNQTFSANPARFFPDEGIGFNVKVIPQDTYFISAGAQDSNAHGTQSGFNTAFDGNYFYAAEFGITPKMGKDLEGIYRVATWYNDPTDRNGKDSGWGIGLSATQFLTPTAGVAFKYSWQSADDVEVEQVASLQYLSYVGGSRMKDVWGVGASWGRPTNTDLRDEYVGEAFYRLQLTRNAQLTPDVQLIYNPSNAPGDDYLAVFGVRIRTAF